MKTENTDLCELDDLVIPRCLLEAAEITGSCDLEIQCVPGAIIITTDNMLDCVPPPLKDSRGFRKEIQKISKEVFDV